jgi:cell wall-associated NlpC family hydrolase
MTVSSLSITAVQDTLNAMQSAAVPTGSSTTNSATASSPTLANDGNDESFATTLAQATTDLAATDGQWGTTNDPLSSDALNTANDPFSSVALGSSDSAFASPSSSATSSADSEYNMLSMLLAGQQSSGINELSSSNVGSTSSGISGLEGDTATGSPSAQDVVSEATQLEGTPYQWGGTTPAGFDCSGFTQYVYAQLGVNLPRTSEEQATAGTAVPSLADAQPGDLLFFAGSDGTASSPGHVGIYVGNGEMIDAPYTGTTVQEQSVATAGPVVAIRRVLSDTSSSSQVMGNVTVPAPYVATIQDAASKYHLPASLLAAVVQHESGFNPNAVSSAGAEGIAQFMPSTASGMGVNPFDPTEAINGAAELLSSYASRFGSYSDALAAYNAGPGAVEEYGGIPPYAETQAYVPAVLSSAGLSGNDVSDV